MKREGGLLPHLPGRDGRAGRGGTQGGAEAALQRSYVHVDEAHENCGGPTSQ